MGTVVVGPLRGTVLNRFLDFARNDEAAPTCSHDFERDFVIPSEVEESIKTTSAAADSL